MTTKKLPHSLEAEKGLVGAMLVHGDRTIHAAKGVGFRVEMFYHPTLQAVWTAGETLAEQGLIVDATTIAAQLGRDETTAKKLVAHGGEAWLADLAANAPGGYHSAPHYARIVAERWQAREFIEGYQSAIVRLYEGAVISDVQADIERLHVTSAMGGRKRRGPRTLQQMRHEAYERLATAAENKRPMGITSGLPDLDIRIGGGHHGGEYTILAGRPGDGKSSLGYGFSLAAATAGTPALFISVEMDESGIALRDLAGFLGVDGEELRMLRFDRSCWLAMHHAERDAVGKKLWIETEISTVEDIMSTVRVWRADAERGGGEEALVVIDYLQLVAAKANSESGKGKRWKRSTTPEEQVASVSASFRDFAKETHTAVVALSQLNRSIADRNPPRPVLTDLRGSGSIEQDAHVVMFVYRPALHAPDKYHASEAEIIIGKQRNGPPACVPVMWDGPHTRYLPAPAEPPPPPEQQSLPGTKPVDFNRRRRGGGARFPHPNAPDSED